MNSNATDLCRPRLQHCHVDREQRIFIHTFHHNIVKTTTTFGEAHVALGVVEVVCMNDVEERSFFPQTRKRNLTLAAKEVVQGVLQDVEEQ